MDIGANDGFLSSNSYLLVQLGWSTVLIEPNPHMLRLAQQASPNPQFGLHPNPNPSPGPDPEPHMLRLAQLATLLL